MSNWQEIYKSKLRTFDEAVSLIKDNDRVWMSPASATPIQLIEALQKRALAKEINGVHLVSGQMLVPFEFLKSAEHRPHLTYDTVFFGILERKLAKFGNININSCQFSQLANALEDYGINVCMCDVSEPDEEGYMSLGPMGVCITPKALELSDVILVQVNKSQPRVKGRSSRIHVSEVTAITEGDHVLPEFPSPPPSELDQKIANLILPEIPDGSTIQIGLGGLSNAIGYGLESKRGLSIHAEMLTECIMHLYEAGAIDGKIEAALGLGSNKFAEWLGEHAEFAPFWEINDPRDVQHFDSLISVNQCLMADLTGQVCSESVGHQQVSGIGGQIDFVQGATWSKGGKSFLCLTSTTEVKGELTSNIMLNLPAGEVVTTPRALVMYIATEYGIADLRNKSIPDRVHAMISIAHPDFREKLAQQAIKAGLITE